MRLTVRGEYALRALTYLGRNYGPEVVPISSIAEAENLPRRFLEQILNDLRLGGFVESRRGVSGGYRLAKAPTEIPLAAVIRHLHGALAPVSCVSEKYYEKCNCPDEARCALRAVMKEVRDTVAHQLEHTSVADLAARAKALHATEPANADFAI